MPFTCSLLNQSPSQISFRRRFQRESLLAVGAFTALLTGCTSVDQQTAFQAVQDQVSTQTGLHVAWNQGSADDAQAETSVRQILANPLNADDAVRIALLNNPDLQASFEEIGISQGDLVQAGLLHNPTLMASWRFPRPPAVDHRYGVFHRGRFSRSGDDSTAGEGGKGQPRADRSAARPRSARVGDAGEVGFLHLSGR